MYSAFAFTVSFLSDYFFNCCYPSTLNLTCGSQQNLEHFVNIADLTLITYLLVHFSILVSL